MVADTENTPAAMQSGTANRRVVNAMSVDVEDYFHVQAMAGRVPRSTWDERESRVFANTRRTLQLFADHNVRATFFTLGWVAKRFPGLVRDTVDAGHELASHGFDHFRVDEQTPDEFRSDIRRTKALLEDIGGVRVTGYRAASFSVGKATPWAHKILAEEGYRYSSSIFPIRHDLYGMPQAPRFPYRPDGGALTELPMTTLNIGGHNMPCSGGGYFRLLPYAYSRWALSRFNAHERRAAVFYFHPWEIDPDQPRVAGLPVKSRARHYINLAAMEPKLHRLLGDFAWDRIDQVFSIAQDARQAA